MAHLVNDTVRVALLDLAGPIVSKVCTPTSDIDCLHSGTGINAPADRSKKVDILDGPPGL